MMKIPNNKEIFETPLSTLWFDDSGVLCTVTKKTSNWSKERYDEVLSLYARLSKDGNNKLCILSDISNTKNLDKDIREHILSETSKYIKASAVLSESSLQASMTNIILKLNMNSFPVRMFSNEIAAIRWLKTYM